MSVSPFDYPARIAALLRALEADPPDRKPLDAMLVSALPNIRYLSGFTGSNALLLALKSDALKSDATVFTDPRYTLQVAQESPFRAVVAQGPLLVPLVAALKREKVRRLGVERNRISFETWDGLTRALPVGCDLAPVDGSVEKLRMVKSLEEIARIRQSVETNSRAFRRALKRFRAGTRESELAAEIDYQSRRAGAEMPAFETIVASGPRSALPHARPTAARIENGSMLLIDMGAFEQGYASDMTRTVFAGKAPKRFRSMYQAVLHAQLAALDAVRPGVTAGQVDRAARKVLEQAEFGAAFIHSTGHGLGLEIHEPPRIGKKAAIRLESGFVITIEPGVYFEGYGGIRIEDTVLVTEGGCEVLTPTPKELVEI